MSTKLDLTKDLESMVQAWKSHVNSVILEPCYDYIDDLQRLLDKHATPADPSQRPWVPGTIITYSDMEATVITDPGGDRINVECEGHAQWWEYEFEGKVCRFKGIETYAKPEKTDADKFVTSKDVEDMQKMALSKGVIVILSPEPTGHSEFCNSGGDYFDADVLRTTIGKNRTDKGENEKEDEGEDK